MPSKLEQIALKKKREAEEAREAEIKSLALKIASEVTSSVKSLNESERKLLEGTIAGLSRSVSEAVVLSNERFDKELKDTFTELTKAIEANKPEKFDNSTNEKIHTKIGNALASLDRTLEALELSPEIKLTSITKDELKKEVDRILNKLPANSKREVTIAYENAPSNRYINVRLTDGINFYKAFGGGGGGGGSSPTVDTGDGVFAVPVANPDGTPLSLGSTSVDTAISDGVTVGDTSTDILAVNENRKSATIVNDSDETIYLKLGSGASLNSGIRINANGGSAKITEYTGIITAISTSGGKVVTVTEL